MAHPPPRQCAGRTGSRFANPDRAHSPTGRTLRHAAAATDRRSRSPRRSRGRTPEEDGGGMEVKAGYKQTEVGVIPEDWELELLGNVGRWFSGGTPSMANDLYWNGDIPWVSAKDMKVSRLYDSLLHITEKAIGNGTRLAPPGAVLMVVRGMILAHTLPVAIAARALTFNQDMKALTTRPGVESEFILRWLQVNAQLVLDLASESTHGTK